MNVPSGARCSRHPETEAAALCRRCGDFLCERCSLTGPAKNEHYCARCEPLAREPFVFERRAELGLLRAFAETALGTFTRTRALYAPGFRDRSVVPALAYGLACSTPVVLVTTAVELVWPSEERRRLASGSLAWALSDEALVVRALASPLFFVLSVALVASLWWTGLSLGGRSPRPFSHVLRAVAYVQGSMAPLGLVALLPDAVDGPLQIVVALFTLVLEGRALAAIMALPARRVATAGAVLVGGLGVLVCVASSLLAWLASYVP